MISYKDQRRYAHTSRKDMDSYMQLLEGREITPDCKIGNKISFWFLEFSGIIDYCQLNICISLEGLNLNLFWRLASAKKLCRDRRSNFSVPVQAPTSVEHGSKGQRWSGTYFMLHHPHSRIGKPHCHQKQSYCWKSYWQLESPNCCTLFSTASAEAHHIVK